MQSTAVDNRLVAFPYGANLLERDSRRWLTNSALNLGKNYFPMGNTRAYFEQGQGVTRWHMSDNSPKGSMGLVLEGPPAFLMSTIVSIILVY